MEFKAIEPGIEINGQTVFSGVDAFKMARCIPAKILFNKGIGQRVNKKFHIDYNDWYQQQVWLDAFKEISMRLGDHALSQIGIKISDNIQFPEWVKDIDSALKLVDISYHMNHRKNGRPMFDPTSGAMLDGIGHYGYSRKRGENMIISECNTPYPCEFDKAVLTAVAQKFKPGAYVTHDDSRPCRKNGNKSCTYKICW